MGIRRWMAESTIGKSGATPPDIHSRRIQVRDHHSPAVGQVHARNERECMNDKRHGNQAKGRPVERFAPSEESQHREDERPKVNKRRVKERVEVVEIGFVVRLGDVQPLRRMLFQHAQ